MTDRILKGCMYVGLFAVPFLPFVVINSLFFPFITGKNFVFRILIEILLAVWIVLFSRKAVDGPKKTWVLIAVLTFLVAISLSAIFGENPYRSFWSNYERMDGLINLLHLATYFFLLASVFVKEKIWNYYLHTTLGVAAIVSVIGFLQLAGKVGINQSASRLDANFGNAIYLGIYMLFHIFIAAYFLVRPNIATSLRIAYLALGVAFSVILYYTGTRGAILGVVGGVVLTLVISLFFLRGKSRLLAALPLILLVLLGGIFYTIRKSDFVTQSPVLVRFANISLKDSTTRTRFIVWGMAMRATLDHPLLGWGPENYGIAHNKYYDPRLHSQETWFDRAHNVFFDWLVTGGIIGLLSYLSMFVAAVWTIWKRASSISPLQKSVLTGLFAGYFFQNIFVFDNLTSYFLFFLMLAFVHGLTDRETEFVVARKLQEFGTSLKNWLAGFHSVATVAVAIIFAFVIYAANVKPIIANRLMLVNLYPRGISEEKLSSLKHLFDLNTFGSMEAREQLLLALTELSGTTDLNRDLMNQYLDLGLVQMVEQLKSTGNDARHQLFLGSYLHTYGRPDDALVYYQNALKLSPKKQIIMFAIARVYVGQGNFSEALGYSKEAYELDKSYARALMEYIAMAIYARDFSLAEGLMESNYRTDIVTDPRIIEVLISVGRIDKVVAIWENEVKLHPERSQFYFSLAASYYAAHRDSEAIATLRKVMELDPATKDMAEKYIAEIEKGSLPRL